MNRRLKRAACKRHSGPAFGGMAAAQRGNVPRRCGIGRPSVAATDAPEIVSRRPIALINATAFWTCPRRVPWIDGYQRHAAQRRLVGQKGPKLSERPTVVRSALRPLNRCPIADMRQIFDGNSAPGVCGLPNDSLADPVVQVGGEARFLPAPDAQQTSGGFGPLFLEVAPKSGVSFAKVGVMGTAERLPIIVGSDVSTAEINAEIFGRVTFWYIANVNRHVEKEHAIAVDQICLTARPFKQCGLIGPADPRHDLSAVISQNGNPISALPGQNTLVVDDGAVRPECRLDILVSLVDLYNLCNGAYRHLSAKGEISADVVVGQFLQFYFVCALIGESDRSQCVTSGIETLHRPQHGISLLGQWQELQLHGQVHGCLYSKRSMCPQGFCHQ